MVVGNFIEPVEDVPLQKKKIENGSRKTELVLNSVSMKTTAEC